jgi:glutamyl-tRNA reductase
MRLVVLGLNHKTAPIEIRECFSFSEEQVKQGIRHLQAWDEVYECVMLSTCNRTEIYTVVEDADAAYVQLTNFLNAMAKVEKQAEGRFFYYRDEDCINHLFRVAASLDSMIVGEGQILSQVKKAYSLARDTGTTGTVLNTLFHRAIAVGKKVRTQTRIAYNAVSVSYAAVELARNVFGELSASNILILGAGEMSELTAKNLVGKGVKTVFVSNRNYRRAVELASKFHGIAVPFEDYLKCAVDADIIITSTGAPHYIIKAWDVAHLMPKRQGRPLVIIDIAVPRDVEPEVEAIAGVRLYNIDTLEEVVDSNIRERTIQAQDAEAIIAEELKDVVDKFRYLAFRTTLKGLTDKAELIRQRELKRAMAKLPDITAQQRKVIEAMSKMLVRKLLRDPIIKVNEAAGTDKESLYLDAIQKLFMLEEAEEREHNGQKACSRYARQ